MCGDNTHKLTETMTNPRYPNPQTLIRHFNIFTQVFEVLLQLPPSTHILFPLYNRLSPLQCKYEYWSKTETARGGLWNYEWQLVFGTRRTRWRQYCDKFSKLWLFSSRMLSAFGCFRWTADKTRDPIGASVDNRFIWGLCTIKRNARALPYKPFSLEKLHLSVYI